MNIATFFKLKENNTTIKTEIIAGITTFLTMAYILSVNPDILSITGMNKGAIFTATALSAVVATLVMALVANLPFALAPGMGLNAFFAYTVCLGLGHTWQFALTAVFIEGIIFILLTAFNIREMIINAIPMNIKYAISAGIGFFITFIGLKNAEIVVANNATIVSLGEISSNPATWVALIAILVGGALLIMKVRGALLISITIGTIIGIPLGITQLPETFEVAPPALGPILDKFEWTEIFTKDMLIVVLTFLFVDMFDTIGTLIGVSSKANMLDKNGNVPNVKKALFADAIGTSVGAVLGTSTVTTFVESAAGVGEGGRTGLTSLTTAIMFALALFFSPLFLMVPSAATAAVLVLVGAMMYTPMKNINVDDYSELIPAYLTALIMPLTYSIAEGIVFGMLAYVFLKVLTGKYKEITPIMCILTAIFILSFFV